MPTKVKLSELFAPARDSLVVYNFMFPRHREDDRPGPTKGSTAPSARSADGGICACCQRPAGASSTTYHAETPEGYQMPMLTVFHRHGEEIRHLWSSEMFYAPVDPGQDPRHTGTLEPLWNIFDLTPEGRPSHWHEQLDYHD